MRFARRNQQWDLRRTRNQSSRAPLSGATNFRNNNSIRGNTHEDDYCSEIAIATMSTAAFAQQPAAPASQQATTAASGADATIVGPGISMGMAATTPIKFVEIKGADLLSSKLVGLGIYNKQNEEIGEVSDIVIGDGKSIIGIIASVGGFLGLGASYVVIDPASMAVADDNGTWKAYVDTTKDDLTKAPKFDYDKMKK